MSDRYQDRPFPADAPKRDSDPLAELARLIGQTDPFATMGRANQPMPPRARQPEPEPEPALETDEGPGPLPWMQRAAAQIPSRQEDFQSQYSEPDFSAPHPLQRYGASHAAPEADYHQEASYAAPESQDHYQDEPAAGHDRYDDALYGQVPGALSAPPPETNYDEPYSYQEEDYADDTGQAAKPRRGGMITVAAVLALAVVGTGGAFAYRTYMGAPRTGEPPIFKADPSPTKIIPPTQTADASGKLIQDRMGGATSAPSSTEKIVSREEQPVDPSARDPNASPRVVFPPLNQNANPPTAASVAPGKGLPANAAPGNRQAATAGNGTLGDEPRKIHTFAVRGDATDTAPAW
jgi:hypothetical protein